MLILFSFIVVAAAITKVILWKREQTLKRSADAYVASLDESTQTVIRNGQDYSNLILADLKQRLGKAIDEGTKDEVIHVYSWAGNAFNFGDDENLTVSKTRNLALYEKALTKVWQEKPAPLGWKMSVRQRWVGDQDGTVIGPSFHITDPFGKIDSYCLYSKNKKA